VRNKKLKAIIAIALILCIIFPVAIWASPKKDGKIIGQAVAPVVVWGNPKSGAPPVSPPEEAYDKPDWSERLAAYLIAAPAKWLLHAVGLFDPLELIYGGDYINQTTDGFQKVQPQPYLSIFTKSEWNGLQKFYKKINEIVPIELVLVVIFMGIAYWYSATRPDSRISFRGYVAGLFLAMLLLRIGEMMFAFLFDINKLLVVQFFSATNNLFISNKKANIIPPIRSKSIPKKSPAT